MRYPILFICSFILKMTAVASVTAQVYNVKAFGAEGNGKVIDSHAINKAIETASAAGGGTVYFPAGTYLSFSIRLKSNISLYFDQGSTLLAATPSQEMGQYDAPEPNFWGDSLKYQDFGHSHWHNSLIWGESLENISIIGPGLINGKGLIKFGDNRKSSSSSIVGQGNKAISLKLCKNVIIRDISMLACGHFALIATGVDNMTIDNVKVDTNRDGFDIDCCKNVRVSNCTVNSPNDDAIVLKTSFGLGFERATENVTITNCQVSGYDLGTLLDGTFKRTQKLAPDKDGVTGRIKLGTESNGSFRNIVISNCVFDRCRGLAIESVDGSIIEDISISNITMRDIVNSPIFIRLGNRARGPVGTKVGAIRRVYFNNIIVSGAESQYASIISGIPDYYIEDVQLSNILINYIGGGTKEQASIEPPEKESSYPEPSMFGTMPAYGFYIRHAKNIKFNQVEVNYTIEDERSPFVLNDVHKIQFLNIEAKHLSETPSFILKNTSDFSVKLCAEISDTYIKNAKIKTVK